jgi:putative ABC transport system ATP-binding protein
MASLQVSEPAVARAAVELDAVLKIYGSGATAVTALDSCSVGFAERMFTAVMGPSGSGKTTLLQCAVRD